MFPTKEKNNLVMITLGWMRDIEKRNSSIAWPLTSTHRKFIEFVENADETLTFSEWSKMANQLMEHHAMARNDIYDFSQWGIHLDEKGIATTEERVVSRKEKDIRVLLAKYRAHYAHDPLTCNMCQGHLPQFCERRYG